MIKYYCNDGFRLGYINNQNTQWMWNSAYFAKILSIAKIAASIDDTYIVKMLNYIKDRQSPDGSFQDRVHISYYCPFSGATKVPLTAFLVSAFLETGYGDSYTKSVNDGIQFLRREVQSMETFFDRAITAYAISLYITKQSSTDDKKKLSLLLDELKDGAETVNNKMFWYKSKKSRGTGPVVAFQIETAAYALLAMIKSPKKNSYMDHILKINNWLMSLKNSYGGYRSSHDTGNSNIFLLKILFLN